MCPQEHNSRAVKPHTLLARLIDGPAVAMPTGYGRKV